MDSETNSLLNVPITDAERRHQRQRSLSGSSDNGLRAPPPAEHARDKQFTPQIGRFSSLRQAGERYDDPAESLYDPAITTRPSTALPGIDEESHYSDHDEEEPINSSHKASPFPRNADTAYAPVRQTHSPQPGPKPQSDTAQTPLSESQFWQPIWLKKLTLALVTVLILGLIIALVVVCHIADSENGIHVSNSAHYLWTHIPTLIFVLLLALWRQIDFQTKSLMPWKELSLGPLSPFETILVDYISDFQITTFLAAFKRLHRAVLITITGLFLTLAVTIAATGLFIVQIKTFAGDFPTAIIGTFDAAALDPVILNIGSFPNTSVYTYAQNIVNGLGAQVGIASGFAYLPPLLANDSKPVPVNSTFTATVDTFVPLITCRAANVTLSGEATIETSDFPYNSTEQPYGSPSNLVLNINEPDLCASWPQLNFTGLDPLHYIVPAQQLETRSEQIFCGGDATADSIILLSMIQTAYSQDLLTNVTRAEGGDLPIALTTSRSVTRMVNVLCQPDYTLSQVNVTNNTALDGVVALQLADIDNPENKTLNGLTAANMTAVYNILLGSDSGLFTSTPDPAFIRTPAFDLFSFATNANYDGLFESDTLVRAAQDVYKGTMPAFAAQNLVSRSRNDSTNRGPVASITWKEERLFTNWTPVIIVITGLGLLALLVVALILFMPENVVPRNPNSIAAAATTLTRSFELNRLLRKLQSPDNKGIEAALNGYEVGTAIAVEEGTGSRSFKIHVTEGRPQKRVQEITPDFTYWHPIWASLPVGVATFLLPLLFIVILEVTQQRSDDKSGLFNVPDDRGTVIGSHYIPAFVTLVIAAIIGNLNFYISLFAPWSSLLKANRRPEHGLLRNVLGHSVPTAILNCIKSRYWGAALSNLATILAALLTVIISGLFVVDHFETEGPTRTLSRLDDFAITRASAYTVDNDQGAAAMLNLIEHNSTFPAFTMDEYAFPKLELQPLSQEFTSGSRLSTDMRVALPAWRGNLTCEVPTSSSVSTEGSAFRISASYDLPDSCRDATQAELNSSTVTFSTDFHPTEGATEFGGRLLDLRFGTNSSQYGHLGEGNSSLVADNPAAGCPSLAFFWGNMQLGNDDQDAINVAICYQQVQNVNVNVTLQQNTTDFDSRQSIPPPREETINKQNNPNGTTEFFDFRIQNNLARQLGSNYLRESPNVDPFFQAMINGSIQMDLSRFVDNRQLALMGISHTYRLYMAQVINALFRQDIPGTGSRLMVRQQESIPDAKTTLTTSRLVQDKTSTIILQVLLGLSAALILAGFILTKMRKVLPCNPSSIAGTMSLLAGSDLCYSPDSGLCECCGKIRRSFRDARGRTHIETSIHADDNEHAEDRVQLIRPNAEWMDDQTFVRIFQGRTYSLGWWAASIKKKQSKRYGVDYGDVGREEGDWYLGKRKNSETFEIFAETTDSSGPSRGRTRALSDVNERGAYARAEPSPGVEAHEMRDLTPRPGQRLGDGGTDGRYDD